MKWKCKAIMFAAILGLALIAGCFLNKEFSRQMSPTLVELPPSPAIDDTANLQFLKMAALDGSYETNRGLTVERIGSIALNGISTPSANYISLLILNHTEEPIGFDDIGFGVQIFQYESATTQWGKVILPYIPEKTSKILPPKTENFDLKVLNSWEFNETDLINVDTSVIRILVIGRGENSNKKYSAYLDVNLRR